MKKLFFVLLICTAFCKAQDKPNIVFILTDDQSYDLLGCTGNTIVQTPNIDKLADNGVLFTNAHVTSAICTPSRISILLSQFERKHGVNFNSGTSVSDVAWQNSYPVVMRNNGYYTGWVGKNHAPIGKGGYQSGLMEKSFDYWYAGHGHLGFYPKDNHAIFNDAIAFTQPEIINEGIDDFLDPNARKLKGALHFLENRPADKPFMLSINFNLPHGAGTNSMKLKDSDDDIYKTLYRDIAIPLPDNYIAKKDITSTKLPVSLFHTEDRQTGYNYVDTPATIKERYIRELQAMTGIDRLIGNLLQKLKALKLDKNTIIIFTSDHGLFGGQQGLGGKALCYEQTTHVPIIVFDPNATKKQRGLKSDALVQTIDIAPTMLAYADIKAPETFQGTDISDLIKDSKIEVRDYVYTENLWSTHFGNPRCESVQTKNWKYIRYYKNNNFSATKEIKYAKQIGIPINEMLYSMHDPQIATYRDYIDSPLYGEQPVYEELYNLKEDSAELNNLAENLEYATVLDNLRTQWKVEITAARGTGKSQVLRYTNDAFPKAKH
ncbi:sulfatase-like hydrolase/transferase [Cellulophaga fucicola]|uniref:Arylsulfatase A n=1 Tax=Cellulophaga fucicola TaxID=76595 RepID=A0A1K1R2M8_9FLAO|nr:sulfatase-like hydrolase/transferase [Cellulophaga fucicola]SFW66277.1 Arylsulfatase A [Cellulophaga fucicola]